MRLARRINGVSSVIKAGIALIALLPGIATLVGLVKIPPSIGTLVSFISVFVGLACLIATGLLSDAISRLRGSLVVAIVSALALVGAIAATEYYLFARAHILSINEQTAEVTIIVPARASPQIRQIIDPYEGDYREALETSALRIRLRDLMERESSGTIVWLVLLLIIAQTTSTGAIMLGAWKLTADEKSGGLTEI